MNRNRKEEQCVYCGSRGPLSRDHIPPRCVFADPLPADLITVPSCDSCNQSFSKDDGDFRTMLAMEIKASEHPEAEKLQDKIVRSLKRPEKRGFTRSLFEKSRLVDLFTQSGIYVGKSQTYEADSKRLNKVAERIILGLFWHHVGRRLPDDYIPGASIYCGAGISPDRFHSATKRLADFALSGEEKTIGRGTFTYWHRFADDDPCGSVWLLRFYEVTWFLGCIMSRRESESKKDLTGDSELQKQRH